MNENSFLMVRGEMNRNQSEKVLATVKEGFPSEETRRRKGRKRLSRKRQERQFEKAA